MMEWLAGIGAGASVLGVIAVACCLGLPLALGVFAAVKGKRAKGEEQRARRVRKGLR